MPRTKFCGISQTLKCLLIKNTVPFHLFLNEALSFFSHLVVVKIAIFPTSGFLQ